MLGSKPSALPLGDTPIYYFNILFNDDLSFIRQAGNLSQPLYRSYYYVGFQPLIKNGKTTHNHDPVIVIIPQPVAKPGIHPIWSVTTIFGYNNRGPIGTATAIGSRLSRKTPAKAWVPALSVPALALHRSAPQKYCCRFRSSGQVCRTVVLTSSSLHLPLDNGFEPKIQKRWNQRLRGSRVL
jgi:hypothetical protein